MVMNLRVPFGGGRDWVPEWRVELVGEWHSGNGLGEEAATAEPHLQ